ncbi:MAG: DUF2209 family protein [Methanotrichaceae archaeon]
MAIDISGRHSVNGRYQMVCAAISARVSPECIEKIYSVRLIPRVTVSIDLNTIIDLISTSVISMPGTVLAEPGDLYNQDAWRISSILGREFKYPETLAERTTIELAHHASVAGRRLITDERVDNNDGQ